MPKLKKPETKPEPVVEAPKEEKKRGRKPAANVEAEVAPKVSAEEIVKEEVVWANPDSFTYQLKAGKSYDGLNSSDVLAVVSGLIGKVPKIIIVRN